MTKMENYILGRFLQKRPHRHFLGEKLSWLIIISTLLSFACTNNNIMSSELNSSSNQKSNFTNEGLCIYATKFDINSDLTYQDINLKDAELIGEPIISCNQIISYDTNNHEITLSYSSDSLKKRIVQSPAYDKVVGVYGLPFIVTLDSEKIYGGWFWTPVSSIPCHSVVIMLDNIFDDLQTNEIKIQLGYPNKEQFKGINTRNNKKII